MWLLTLLKVADPRPTSFCDTEDSWSKKLREVDRGKAPCFTFFKLFSFVGVCICACVKIHFHAAKYLQIIFS